jgi:hypothetical protein
VAGQKEAAEGDEGDVDQTGTGDQGPRLSAASVGLILLCTTQLMMTINTSTAKVKMMLHLGAFIEIPCFPSVTCESTIPLFRLHENYR